MAKMLGHQAEVANFSPCYSRCCADNRRQRRTARARDKREARREVQEQRS